MPSIRVNRATVGALVIALILWGVPAFAAKVAISEAELDGISAAGEPTVIATGTNSYVNYTSQPVFTMDFGVPDAQSGLSALTIQNVVGELQLLVNLNVLSAVSQVAGTEQRNFSMQSWGATDPIADTVKTVAGVAAAPCLNTDSCNTSGGNAGTANAGNGAVASSAPGGAGGAGGSIITPVNTGGGTQENTASGGNGGNAAAAPGNTGSASAPAGNGAPVAAVGNGATSPGVISPAASASGDVIITSGDGSPVTAMDQPVFTLAFTASEAQKDLSALFISNVVGRSQFALNLNIASAAFTTVPFAANPIGGDVTGVVKQVNTGIQFRGTPITGTTSIGITHTN